MIAYPSPPIPTHVELILIEKSNRLRNKQKYELKNSITNNKVTLKWLEKLNLKNVACLACAHPVKFQETVKQSLQQDIQYDKNFNFDQNEKFNVLDNNYLLLKEYIQNHA